MKWFSFFLPYLLAQSIFCQQLAPTVISSAGTHLSQSVGSLEFTLGELAIATLGNGNILTQGFHQPELAVSTSIHQEEFSALVYPNPFHNELIVQLDKQDAISLQLFNTLGIQVMNDKIMDTNKLLDLTRLKIGIYYLKLTRSDGISSTLKLIKL